LDLADVVAEDVHGPLACFLIAELPRESIQITAGAGGPVLGGSDRADTARATHADDTIDPDASVGDHPAVAETMAAHQEADSARPAIGQETQFDGSKALAAILPWLRRVPPWVTRWPRSTARTKVSSAEKFGVGRACWVVRHGVQPTVAPRARTVARALRTDRGSRHHVFLVCAGGLAACGVTPRLRRSLPSALDHVRGEVPLAVSIDLDRKGLLVTPPPKRAAPTVTRVMPRPCSRPPMP